MSCCATRASPVGPAQAMESTRKVIFGTGNFRRKPGLGVRVTCPLPDLAWHPSFQETTFS